jgi:hypothetical protein
MTEEYLNCILEANRIVRKDDIENEGKYEKGKIRWNGPGASDGVRILGGYRFSGFESVCLGRLAAYLAKT